MHDASDLESLQESHRMPKDCEELQSLLFAAFWAGFDTAKRKDRREAIWNTIYGWGILILLLAYLICDLWSLGFR